MHEIDKDAFGCFLTQLRKERGYTQKELAETLFVSDKAVSKWERGLSLPDISLLIPLAEILDVTVTELLEGRRMEEKELPARQVEEIVQKALKLSEGDSRKHEEKTGRKLAIFTAAALTAFFEILLAEWWMDYETTAGSYLVYELLSVAFGIYFWFLMPLGLPKYYDENSIGFYSDGILKISLPGVAFNNSNWTKVVKSLRMWSIGSMITVPCIAIFLSMLPISDGAVLGVQMGCLFLYLASLFVPIYLCARKTGKTMGKEKKKV